MTRPVPGPVYAAAWLVLCAGVRSRRVTVGLALWLAGRGEDVLGLSTRELALRCVAAALRDGWLREGGG